MSDSTAMSSRARLIACSPATLILASAAMLSVSAPRANKTDGRVDPDTVSAFTYPTGIAVGSDGTVYVASSGDSSVVAFAPGASGPARPMRRLGGPGTDFGTPRGIAIDSHGRLLVSLDAHPIRGKGSITVFGPTADGNARPIRTIVGPDTRLETPVGIALGRRGRIYVANGNGNVNYGPNTSSSYGGDKSEKAVLAFDASADGNAAPQQSLPDTPGSSRPVDITVDTAGNLVTVNGSEVVVWGDLGPLRRVFGSKEQQQGNFIFTSGGGAFISGNGGSFLGPVGNAGNTAAPGLPPTRVAVGPTGALYVAPRLTPVARQPDSTPAKPDVFGMLERLQDPKTVAIYNQAESSDTVPQRLIGGGQSSIAEIRDMAVGRDGALYVLGRVRGRGVDRVSVVIFSATANGDVEPARVIAGPCTRMNNPVAIAVDRTNRVYVASNFGGDDPMQDAASVAVYAADASGDAAPIRWIVGPRTRLLAPTALAVADDGTVYVANAGTWNDDNGSVRLYAADAKGAAPPLRTLVGIETRLISPTALAVGRGDTLYVVGLTRFHFGGNRLMLFPPNAGGETPPVRTIEGASTGFSEPARIAVDDAGVVYVANRKEASGINAYGPDLGSVTVYQAGAAGNQAPKRTIEGSYTRLNGPSGIARDRAGNIYVANHWGTGPGSVTIYGPQADEDVRPVRMIAGPTTRLQSPGPVALDAHDTLYVVNEHTVTVYAPGATGDAPPVRTIGGP